MAVVEVLPVHLTNQSPVTLRQHVPRNRKKQVMVIGRRLSLTTKIRTQFLLCSSIGVFAYIDQEVEVTTRCFGTPLPVKWKIDSRPTGHMKILPYMSVH